MNLVIDDAVEVSMPTKKGDEEENIRRELGETRSKPSAMRTWTEYLP